MNTNFTGEVGHPDRPTDRPGYVPHPGGGSSITGQSFCSRDFALLRNRRPSTEVVSHTGGMLAARTSLRGNTEIVGQVTSPGVSRTPRRHRARLILYSRARVTTRNTALGRVWSGALPWWGLAMWYFLFRTPDLTATRPCRYALAEADASFESTMQARGTDWVARSNSRGQIARSPTVKEVKTP